MTQMNKKKEKIITWKLQSIHAEVSSKSLRALNVEGFYKRKMQRKETKKKSAMQNNRKKNATIDIDKLVNTFQDKTASMLLQSGFINIEFWKNVFSICKYL